MRAANKSRKMQNGSTEANVLQRVLQLPVVNATCESLQRTYTSTKEVHPLVASVCEAYERGVKGASSLAVWSMEPVVRRLEPQFTAANILACRGLDHLEEKIPALQYPVEKIASELKGSISTPIQSARSTIGNSIAGTLDRVLGLTAEGYELTKSTVRNTAEYTWSSQVSQMAAAGVDGALGQLEKLVEFLLPEEEHEPAHEPTRVHGSEVTPSQPQPGTFTRIGALASIISHRAYQQTAKTIQRTRARGQELTIWIPGLGAVARQSTAKAQQVLYDVQNAAAGWLSKEQSKEPEQEQEKEELKKEETKASDMAEDAKTPGLLGSLAQSLQTAYLSTISNMKRVPSAAWGTAGELLQLTPRKATSIAREKVGTLGDALRSVTGSIVETLSHYVPLPRVLAKKEESAHEKEPPPESQQSQEGSRPVAPPYPEKSQLQGDWQANRAHYPLSFLGLEDPFFLQPSSIQRHAPQQSPTFEPDYPMSRKSAFPPYRERLSTRRVSKNSYRYSPEPVYTRANYSNLYTMAFKKD
ncbi:perilipin-1 [Chelonoidis abingdonii]|uniref:perilipin-1 n=1 Tax=Chelonoidis abingdonii TaxID=106734 RepID=UPI0013F2AE7B|nr:perilipin-1-like isoform X1 [Chelonoidis abingdonii]XP_032662403.1 perilipin-1-like isoform X1 [Chelonoidis abingdonii]XP_032662404.1 perilipin-1-like isoform X1 [Chelonoidis abingdonii]